MSNALLVFWAADVRHDDDAGPPRIPPAGAGSGREDQASATIFVVMRRMRAPLIILIVIFSISVLGLALIPGAGPGRPAVPHDASSTRSTS